MIRSKLIKQELTIKEKQKYIKKKITSMCIQNKLYPIVMQI